MEVVKRYTAPNQEFAMTGTPIPLNIDSFLANVEKRAYRMAIFATKQPSDALDIVQETMLKLVQHYRTRPATEWGPLFQTILQRNILQWHRNQTRQRRWFWQAETEADEERGFDIAAPEHEIPENQWQLNASREAIVNAVEQLPMRQQQTFLLRAWEGYDVSTTAQIMSCSEGSVKTHYSRAVQALRKSLEGV